MVNSGDLSDDEVSSLSEEVASKLRNQLGFPGQIKLQFQKKANKLTMQPKSNIFNVLSIEMLKNFQEEKLS